MNKINTKISFLRIFATLAVIFLHTCSTLIQNPDIFEFTHNQEVFMRIGHYIFIWAVPVFFMITGFLLIGSDKKLDYKITLKKYVSRIFYALTLFGIPFAAVKIFLEKHCFSVKLILKAYLENDSFAHLWYLYVLIGIYLVMPVFKPAIKNADVNTLTIFVISLFVFNFLIPQINSIFEINIAFCLPITYSLFYITVGFLMQKTSVLHFFTRKVSIILVALSIISIVFLVVFKKWHNIADSYTSPLTAIYSISIYSLFINSKDKKPSTEKFTKFIWKVDRLCFAVYLIHPIFIQFAYRFLKITPLSFNAYPLAVVCFFIVFSAASFAASYIMNLIPVLRKYVL